MWGGGGGARPGRVGGGPGVREPIRVAAGGLGCGAAPAARWRSWAPRAEAPPLGTRRYEAAGSRFVPSLDYELLEGRHRVSLIFLSPASSTVPGTEFKLNFGTWPLLHQGLILVITTVEGYSYR